MTSTIESHHQAKEQEQTQRFKEKDRTIAEDQTSTDAMHSSFPSRLHDCLSSSGNDGFEHIISWETNGRSFSVHKQEEFVNTIMSRFFSFTSMSAFLRQLMRYGFSRISHGKDKGNYHHTLFVKEHPSLARKMTRARRTSQNVNVNRLSKVEEANFQALGYGDSDQESEYGETFQQRDDSSKVVTPAVSPLNSPRQSPVPCASPDDLQLLPLQGEEFATFCNERCAEMGWDPAALEPTHFPDFGDHRGSSIFTLVDPAQNIYALRPFP
ncbi:hypothetical protein ACA910_003730 [Epithemia clementina (nom. ined.)]